ncbi:hypothetical protein JCM1841_000242 [Sporobolomyces salmonicolor]
MHSTFSLLALLLAPTALVALPTAMPSFEDLLALSPRDLVPSYSSAPKPLQKRIDYFPAFTSPSQGSTWQAGGELTVAWNNTLPPYASNQIHYAAVIYLGYLDDSSPGLNLDVDHPLANVSLYDSPDPIQVTLPADLETRSTYLLVMGSTSNMSPQFTVNAVSAVAASSSTSSTSANPSTTAHASTPHVTSSLTSSSSTTAAPLSTRTTLYLANGDSTVLSSSSTTAATPASSSVSSSSSSSSESAGAVPVPVASSSSSPLPSSASTATSSSSSSASASTSASASAPIPTVATPAVAAASASATKTSGATTSQIGRATTLLLAGVVAAAMAL